MQRLKLFITSGTLFLLPVIASAQLADQGRAKGGLGGTLIDNIITFINDTLIPFILAIAFLIFVWGVFSYFILRASNEDKRKDATKVMLYSVSGFLLILIFWGIINLLVDFTGLGNEDLKTDLIPGTPKTNP